jgi:hypothetical protein
MTCPQQLSEESWHSRGDMDPTTAHVTRTHLWTRLQQPNVWGVGSHFPRLEIGTVIVSADNQRNWSNLAAQS